MVDPPAAYLFMPHWSKHWVQGGNEIEIVLCERNWDYGGMKLDHLEVEKKLKIKILHLGEFS